MFSYFKKKIKSWTKKLSEEKTKEEELETNAPKEEIQKEESKQTKEKPIKEKKVTKEKKGDLKKEEPKQIQKEIKLIQEETLKTKPKKNIFSKIFSQTTTFTQEDFFEHQEDLEMLLLENNVAIEVSEKIIQEFQELAIGKEFSKKNFEEEILELFKGIISEILIEPFDIIEKINETEKKPFVILFCGINGAGKTTTLAKLANYLKEKNYSSVLAAGDTFRAASIEQLNTHSKKLDIPLVSMKYGSDPASIGFEAIKYAQKNNIDVVLIDTAGRMHTATNLMQEIEKIARVCKPDLKIFVGESISGNDIVSQAKAFNEAVSIDGIILAKADIDEKGGSALSVGYSIKKPILFLGMGQEYSDIEKFNKEIFLKKLF